MKIFVWTSIIISYLFIALSVLPFQVFIAKTTVTNKLDKEIFVTPFGRERSTITKVIPLEYKFLSISNPFNKKISLKPKETIELYYDNDCCMFDGLLISKEDTLFKVNNNKQMNHLYIIDDATLTDKADKSFDDYTKYNFIDFIGFAFQISLLLYAPIMTVIILRKKIKNNNRKTT